MKTDVPVETHGGTAGRPLRLWPGVVAAALLLLAMLGLPAVLPDSAVFGVLGGVVLASVILVWWLFFSRARWSERLGTLVLVIVAALVTRPFLHESIRNEMMGMMFTLYAAPVLSFALVAGVLAGRRLRGRARYASMAAAIVLACVSMTAVRTGGISGDGRSDFHWRWTKTPEERLLARAAEEPPAPSPAPVAAATPAAQPLDKTGDEPAPPPSPHAKATADASSQRERASTGNEPTLRAAESAAPEPAAEWPGFRGPARDGIARGVRIETNWSTSAPVQLWRRPIGPGWSSFAVRGDFFYTQEQRGDEEIVSCYKLTTGEPVWTHRDPVRFWESNGGAGPRATPTLGDGRLYTFGATGIVNALDAATGAVVWSRNAATDSGKEVPEWGFASSPLVVGDLVIVAAASQLVAYDAGTGERRWLGPPEGGGYSSPHLVTIDGVAQVLLLRGRRTTSFAPADGSVLWEHSWEPAVSIVQPALFAASDVLIAAGDSMGGIGMRRVAVAHSPTGWSVEERWTSRGLKPYFNDFVVHAGHAYGFDGSILACIDLSDGARKWKGGRYGHGQIVLLPDQDVLLVLSEEGELALVKAAPDQYRELARVPAIEGKTWNHPALAGDVVLVRNGEEMAAFRLAPAATAQVTSSVTGR